MPGTETCYYPRTRRSSSYPRQTTLAVGHPGFRWRPSPGPRQQIHSDLSDRRQVFQVCLARAVCLRNYRCGNGRDPPPAHRGSLRSSRTRDLGSRSPILFYRVERITYLGRIPHRPHYPPSPLSRRAIRTCDSDPLPTTSDLCLN